MRPADGAPLITQHLTSYSRGLVREGGDWAGVSLGCFFVFWNDSRNV